MNKEPVMFSNRIKDIEWHELRKIVLPVEIVLPMIANDLRVCCDCYPILFMQVQGYWKKTCIIGVRCISSIFSKTGGWYFTFMQ